MKMETARRKARRESSGDSREGGLAEAKTCEGAVTLSLIGRSFNFEYEKSDVVVLRASGVGARPAAQFEQQRVCQVSSRFRGVRKEFLQARFAELFAGGVHGFQNAVGVKENAVACAERDFHGSIRGIWKKAEDQAVGFEFAAFGVAPLRAE